MITSMYFRRFLPNHTKIAYATTKSTRMMDATINNVNSYAKNRYKTHKYNRNETAKTKTLTLSEDTVCIFAEQDGRIVAVK